LRPVLFTLLAILLAGVVVVGAYIGMVAFAAKQAADQIFQPPARETIIAAVSTPTALPATPKPGQPTPTVGPTPEPTAATEILPEWQGTERINVLLMGVDTRAPGDVPRSDTMILVSIDPVSKQVGMMSIPRDLWVTIPGHGQDKINAAFPLGEQIQPNGGGPALAMETVEKNFRVPVHHYATVDFQGFVKIVDAVGGITVEVPYPIKDDEYPTDDGSNYTRLYVSAGLQHLDGLTALRFARTRHYDSDFGRQRRQQQVLTAIRQQGMQLNLLPRVPELINLLAGSVRTDFQQSDIPALVSLGMSIERENIKSYGMTPAMVMEYNTPELYYLDPVWPEINAAFKEMLTGSGGDAVEEQATPVATPRATLPKPTPATSQRPAATPTAEPVALRVWVRNATRTAGLAARNAEVLRAKGYTIVDVSQDPNTGAYARSIVYNYGTSNARAREVAQALGLPASAVKLGPSPAPPGTDVLVILGDDAVDS
jgi:LCP family protein required for cell wall assembly